MMPADGPSRGQGSYKKLINDPFEAVDEALEGFVAAHADMVRLATPRVVVRRTAAADKVGLVVGGGSGHEPAFGGYVGEGMADAAACGNIFASPPADVVLEAIRAAASGRGVILAYGNYAGDVMNFGLAAELAAAEGIEVREIRVSDDVASAPRAEAERRRGIAGDIIVFKCVGAAAERGDSLDEVERIARLANAATRSMGVALAPCEVPGSGHPTFELAADEMEIGLGIHGEPGVRRVPLQPADEIATTLVETIVADIDGGIDSRRVALLVNGLGATEYLDLYILYRSARRLLEGAGAEVARSFVGEFITSLEMSGASITVTLLDDELTALLDAGARTVGITIG
jgi:dihydroxyacetone kinase